MDPNALLLSLLTTAQTYQTRTAEEIPEELIQLCQGLLDLDIWLRKGGFLPKRWQLDAEAIEDALVKLVRTRFEPKTESGRRKSWAFVVTGIKSKTARGVKAFEGYYLKEGHEVDLLVGSLVLEVAPEGSVNRGWQSAHIYIIDAAGEWSQHENLGHWSKDFLTIRDTIESKLK